MILDKIVEVKKAQLMQQKLVISPEEMKRKATTQYRDVRSFKKALLGKGVAIIGEIKKASPSKGLICESFDPVRLAKVYEECGVQALSILTETEFFQGSLQDLKAARAQVSLPILRKDFIIDPYQIDEAYISGADAILLIVRILSDEKLKEMIAYAKQYGLDTLVETHNQEEIERATQAGADIIGINNRDLQTFHTTLETTRSLIKYRRPGQIFISESGITSAQDLKCVKEMSVDGVLIGETFMKSQDLKQTLSVFKNV